MMKKAELMNEAVRHYKDIMNEAVRHYKDTDPMPREVMSVLDHYPDMPVECYECGIGMPSPVPRYRLVLGSLLPCCVPCMSKPLPEGPVERWKTAGHVKRDV